MQPRLGLGLRPSFGQGPPIGALAQMGQFLPPQKQTTLFVGSISGGIQDDFLTEMLKACGPLRSWKRLITPANKPQGFGFAEFDDPESALRAIQLLQNVELPALEDGCANKKLLVKPDEKTRAFLDAYSSQRKPTEADTAKIDDAQAKIDSLLAEINKKSDEYAENGIIDKEKYIIPPHLHDLQEADLPETQRGLVISEIAQFRERAAKREREKMRDVQQSAKAMVVSQQQQKQQTPSGPKQREWGKPQGQSPTGPKGKGYKPSGFVKAGETTPVEDIPDKTLKTDEELEQDRKDARKREEENSFRDRERRYEPRERTRIAALERAIARERQTIANEDRDRVEMRHRLDIWDDDESDELFYVDRTRWRQLRVRRLEAEEAADAKSRKYEEQETENLKKESEEFLAKQMDELQALADEQRKAGLLLDDGAPVRLNVSLASLPPKERASSAAPPEQKAKVAFSAAEEEEEDTAKKRKVPLVKLEFSVAESSEKIQERLEKIKESVPHDKESLFAGKVRWDGMNDLMIDRKMEPLVKRLLFKYLGEMEEDLIMFVVEHLKDHKGPHKLVEGLEPVLEEDAIAVTIGVWRQLIFESIAYGEGLHTEKMLVD